ncbi:MAG TPA: gamma-glutamyltransferase [Sphingomonadaceae bacterium]|nr:gamma-glutamyltransferase [Sphingomonadaceae bacterium]
MSQGGDGSSALSGAARWRAIGAAPVMAEQMTARGHWGMVAAAAPTAALIGAEILRAGGNAYDAAAAMGLAETVLLPPKCGLGGDLIALAWDKGAPAPEALLAIGGAPAGLGAVAAAGGMTETGPTSIGVPAAPMGYLALAAKGRLPFGRLAEPAIGLAARGFAWSRICSVLCDESRQLVAAMNPEGTVYYPYGYGGDVLTPGTPVRLPGMAAMLEELVARGPDFFGGPVGDAVAARVARAGGVLTKEDLLTAQAEWLPATAASLAGMALHVTPLPTHGGSLADAVAGLDPVAAGSQPRVYREVVEAINRRRRDLSGISGTSMVTAVDDAGTIVTLIHSNSYPRFGSGLIVPEFDMILANRAGRGFSSTVGHANFPEAGKRPVTTLHAWAVQTGDGTRLMGATPGGANQMPWNAQTLARIAAGETDPGKLIVAPRWEWRPSDDGVVIEEGFDEDVIAGFRAAAPSVHEVPRWATRPAMQIACVAADGAALLAADPRTVGMALAL